MSFVVIVVCLALIASILWDAFETMMLPRRVSRKIRLARFFYRSSWLPWTAVARRIRPGKRRDVFLSVFGPLSLLVLFFSWAVGLVIGFAFVHWGLGTPMHTPDEQVATLDYVYLSGVTFFTLGFGDVTPSQPLGRLLAVVETGVGFGFLALLISYLPVLYQAFSARELTISMLDARAGSPPTAAQLLLRVGRSGDFSALDRFLEEWEKWAASVLESHLSFPMLAYYRSQHDNQSWLAALTAMLDTCALVIAGVRDRAPYQAQLTFAMARHTVVDLAQVFQAPPRLTNACRMADDQAGGFWKELEQAGFQLRTEDAATAKLTELRGMYEPFLYALSDYFLLALPPVQPPSGVPDNWQTSAWMRRTSGIGTLAASPIRDDHDE